MLDLLTAAAAGLALGLIAVAIIKRRERRPNDDFMFNKDHWGA